MVYNYLTITNQAVLLFLLLTFFKTPEQKRTYLPFKHYFTLHNAIFKSIKAYYL